VPTPPILRAVSSAECQQPTPFGVPPGSSATWRTFLRNHVKDIVAVALAESVCIRIGRQYPQRVSRSGDRARRATPEAHPHLLPRLRPSVSHAPRPGHGLPGWPRRSSCPRCPATVASVCPRRAAHVPSSCEPATCSATIVRAPTYRGPNTITRLPASIRARSIGRPCSARGKSKLRR